MRSALHNPSTAPRVELRPRRAPPPHLRDADEPNSRTPFKPGIVSHRAGAALHLVVDTSALRRPALALQYLESHVGMGVVDGSCRGCSCAPFRIDARGQIARQSTNG